MLTDRFGPPVELGPSLRDQVVGSLMAWQWHVVILSVIALGVVGVVVWRRRLQSRRRLAPHH